MAEQSNYLFLFNYLLNATRWWIALWLSTHRHCIVSSLMDYLEKAIEQKCSVERYLQVSKSISSDYKPILEQLWLLYRLRAGVLNSICSVKSPSWLDMLDLIGIWLILNISLGGTQEDLALGLEQMLQNFEQIDCGSHRVEKIILISWKSYRKKPTHVWNCQWLRLQSW